MTYSVEIRSEKNTKINPNWPDLKSALKFDFHWQSRTNSLLYQITISTPSQNLIFNSANFSLTKEEINKLSAGLQNFLNHKKIQTWRFEPLEPNFELIVSKTKLKGITLYFWLDQGNADFHHYTWDALGLRFYTNHHDLQTWSEELIQIYWQVTNFSK